MTAILEAGTSTAAPERDTSNRDMTRTQIYKYVTKDRILEISDMLNLEPKRSKIAFHLVEFEGKGEASRAITKVRHYADVPDFKLVCWDVLHNCFTEWTDHKGTPNGEGLEARTMTVRKDVKYRQPFVIKIDNGVGEAMPGGAVKMARATDSLTLLMPEWDARRMAQVVLDYIRDWETVNFRQRREAQTILVPRTEVTNTTESPIEVLPTSRRQRYARAT